MTVSSNAVQQPFSTGSISFSFNFQVQPWLVMCSRWITTRSKDQGWVIEIPCLRAGSVWKPRCISGYVSALNKKQKTRLQRTRLSFSFIWVTRASEMSGLLEISGNARRKCLKPRASPFSFSIFSWNFEVPSPFWILRLGLSCGRESRAKFTSAALII